MSRIGRKLVSIPSGVDVSIADGVVSVTGPKGSLQVTLHPHVTVAKTEDHALTVTVKDPNGIDDRALWGLFRKLVENAVVGVHTPFVKSLEFVGVGYRVDVSGRTVKMEVGYSHPVLFDLPEGVEAKVEKQILTLSSTDKQLVGESAAQIRRVRPPEPYKGKGIKYTDEVIRRKAGKSAKASA